MKFVLLPLLVIAVLSTCQGEVGTTCTSDDQCDADECCEIINIVVMSRKRQILSPLDRPNTSGTCQKLKQEGEYCSGIGVMNGYCGCAPNLSCTPIPWDQWQLRGRRDEMPAHCTAN